MKCPDCMGTGESFPMVHCKRCNATGEAPDERWWHIAQEVDGRFAKGPFATRDDAFNSLTQFCGHTEQFNKPGQVGREIGYSDIGGQHWVERHDRFETAAELLDALDAFDAIECGEAGPADIGEAKRLGY